MLKGNTNMSGFLSVDNFNTLSDIFSKFLAEKYSVTADKLDSLNIKTQLLQTMQNVSDTLPSQASLREANEKTLVTLKNTFLQGIHDTSRRVAVATKPAAAEGFQAASSASDMMEPSGMRKRTESAQSFLPMNGPTRAMRDPLLDRDRDLYGNRPLLVSTQTPQGQPVEKVAMADMVKRQYDLAMKDREIRRSAPISAEEVFGKPVSDSSLSVGEFSSRLEKIQQDRTAPLLSSAVAAVASAVLKNEQEHDAAEKEKTQEKEPGEKEIGSIAGTSVLDRNDLLASVRKTSPYGELNPKNVYSAGPLPGASGETPIIIPSRMQDISGLLETSKERLLLPQAPLQIKERYILINSVDRDWVSQKKRFQYKVKFNVTSQTTRRVPFYHNNPTIPYTATLATAGIPNTSGWYGPDNTFYPAYNPSDTSPLAQTIIGYEELVLPVDNDANIQTNFRNIHSIAITSVIIPTDVLNTSGIKNRYNHNFNLNFPYLLLSIDEFRDVYEGTTDAIRKSFCQLVYKDSYQSSNGRGYIVMRPVQCEKKVFYPTALSTLPSMSISLLKPNGELVNKSEDGFGILKLEYEAYNPKYLKIVLTKYVDRNEFYEGDTVLVRSYLLFKIMNTQDQTQITRVNAYINRTEGHEILQLGDANENGYYRTFYIQAPGSFNESSGQYDVDSSMIDQITIFNSCYDFSAEPSNGFVLNLSLQNSISMKIEQRDYDSTMLGSLNI